MQSKNAPIITMASVSQHNKESDLWIAVDGKAYNCTAWQHAHPGGARAILNFAGKDCTTDFNRIHSKSAKEMLKDFEVGPIQSEEKALTMEDVQKHSTEEDCYVVIDGNAYDVTQWAEKHPGGKKSVTGQAGKDASKIFHQMHSAKTIDRMQEFLVGPVKQQHLAVTGAGLGASSTSTGGGAAAVSKRAGPSTNKYKLLESEDISHNTKRLYFVAMEGEKPSPDSLLPGGHMVVEFDHPEEKGCARNYTPVSHKPGHFELIVKKYDNGKGSTYLHGLEPNKEGQAPVIFRGPIDPLYDFRANRASFPYGKGISTLVLVAGGTGVAPMYSIAEAALKEQPCPARIIFLGCFRDEDDILMEEEVLKLAKIAQKPSYLSYSAVLSRQKGALQKQKPYAVFNGRFEAQFAVMSGVPSPYQEGTEVVVCGPPAFNDHVAAQFESIKVPAKRIHLM